MAKKDSTYERSSMDSVESDQVYYEKEQARMEFEFAVNNLRNLMENDLESGTRSSHVEPRSQSRTSSSAPLSAPASPPKQLDVPLCQEVFFIAVIVLSHFMTQAALGQTIAPLAIIGRSFHTENAGELSWFVAAYSLTVGTFILISGRLGDIVGYKPVFLAGWAWFGLWSSYAGFASFTGKQIFFDFCRAMQGIGPALLLPNALALLGRAYPPSLKKNLTFALFGAVAPAGFVIGALFGSIFGQLSFWPWAFWSFTIVCFAIGILATLVVPAELGAPLPGKPRPSFDLAGSLTGVSGLVLFNVAWNNAPLFGWGTPHVFFTLIIGIIVLAGFLWIEFTHAQDPILPVKGMSGTTAFVLGCIGFGWGTFGIWVLYTWRFLEEVRHLTPLNASAQFVPAIIAGFMAAGLTGALLAKTPVPFVMLISMMAFFAGNIIAGTMPVKQVYFAQMFISIIVMPFGMDMSFPAASIILSNNMPPELQGQAASLINTVLNYSISIAVGVAGTVESVVIKHKQPSPATTLEGIRAGYITAVVFSGLGILCGGVFFVRTLSKEGWKVVGEN